MTDIEAIKYILTQNPSPAKGRFIIDIEPNKEFPGYLLVFYSDNFEEFSEPMKLSILEWLNKALQLINKLVVCGLEKREYAP